MFLDSGSLAAHLTAFLGNFYSPSKSLRTAINVCEEHAFEISACGKTSCRTYLRRVATE